MLTSRILYPLATVRAGEDQIVRVRLQRQTPSSIRMQNPQPTAPPPPTHYQQVDRNLQPARGMQAHFISYQENSGSCLILQCQPSLFIALLISLSFPGPCSSFDHAHFFTLSAITSTNHLKSNTSNNASYPPPEGHPGPSQAFGAGQMAGVPNPTLTPPSPPPRSSTKTCFDSTK
eukprot:1047746-Rhodomonas_salina.1